MALATVGLSPENLSCKILVHRFDTLEGFQSGVDQSGKDSGVFSSIDVEKGGIGMSDDVPYCLLCYKL